MRRVMVTVGLAALAFGSANTTAADPSWVEATSPHFTVISDNGQKTARQVLWQFEQVRAALSQIWPWVHVDLEKPMLVITTNNESGMKALAPQYWAQPGGIHPSSVSAAGLDRFYVALRTDLKIDDKVGVNPYRSAYWSYVSLVLPSGIKANLPMWFVRGVADVMSNTIVGDNEIQVGRTIPTDLQLLRSGAHPTLRELVAVDRQSPWATQQDRLPTFDAECWAFVHYLLFADNGAHRDGLNRFVALLLEGKTSAAALDQSIGNLDALTTTFNAYINAPLFPYSVEKTKASVSPEAFPTRVLPVAEHASARAALHAATGHPEDARPLIDQARNADPRQPDSYEAEGILADAERKPPEALAAYTRAIELGSSHYYPYYRWALLTPRPPVADTAARAQLEQALERATTLNPGFAPAYSALAEIKQQDGRGDEAISAAVRAVTIEPNQVQPRLVLARVLWSLSRKEDAQKAATDALEVAQTPNDKRAAQQLVDTYQRTGPAMATGARSGPPPPGLSGGIVGGISAVPPPPPPSPGAPVRVAGAIKTPVIIKHVDPTYPPEAQTARVQGVVIIEATIGTDGAVTNTQVLRSIPLLDEAALAAVKEWVYEPTRLDGVAVAVIMTVTVNFVLK